MTWIPYHCHSPDGGTSPGFPNLRLDSSAVRRDEIPIYKILNITNTMISAVAVTQAEKYADIVAKDIPYSYINTPGRFLLVVGCFTEPLQRSTERRSQLGTNNISTA